MSRKVVVIEEVVCDVCGDSDDLPIENFEWSWKGRDLEVDLCQGDAESLESGELTFSTLYDASRPRKIPCDHCDRTFDTLQGKSTHESRKHKGKKS